METCFFLKKGKDQFVFDSKIKPESAKFLIIPVPYEQTTSYGKGTKYGPQEIIKASSQLELWDEELKEDVYKVGIFTAEALKFTNNEKLFFKKIGDYVNNLLRVYKGFPIFLGGEHSITQGLIPPFAQKYDNLSILHFDAHADLRSEYEGSVHSHACALYPASLRLKVVQIGIRSVASEEKHLINKGNVKTFLMHENLDIKTLKRKIINDLGENVYLTIDVDGFDPSIMPATGTPQPGGFMWYDALEIFKEIIFKKNVVGFDVVEVSPVKNSIITEFNAAKLIYRLIGYISRKRKYI
ncbi:MAG: agmatinase [Elusimicrobiota bacterium]